MNKFLIIAIIYWAAMTVYNIFFDFNLLAVIIETTWLTLNVLVYTEEKDKDTYPKRLSRRKIRKLVNSMPKVGDKK